MKNAVGSKAFPLHIILLLECGVNVKSSQLLRNLKSSGCNFVTAFKSPMNAGACCFCFKSLYPADDVSVMNDYFIPFISCLFIVLTNWIIRIQCH